jgi:hypothetical protein
MAEEKRVIFSFLTLDGFKARLADGTFTPQGNYMVFIQDKKLIWTKGQYFAESNVAIIKLSRPTPKSPGYNITEEEARTIDEAYANGKVLIFIYDNIPLLVKSITPSESEDLGSYEAFATDVIYSDSLGFKLLHYRISIDTKSLLVTILFSDDEELSLTNTGSGNEYLANDGKYHVINTESVETTEAIPVAGGPLAELLNNAGITSISSKTNMQDLLMSLFTKELWPSQLTFKEGTITSSIGQPTFTLNKSGLVEVGTEVTISEITINAASSGSTNRSYSGFTYGYSIANDNTKDNSSTTINVSATGIASTNDAYTLKRTINSAEVSAPTNTNPSQVKLDTTTFEAIEGNNSVKAEVTGTKYSGTFAEIPVYYACSNLGKTSASHKSDAKSQVTITSSIPSNSKTISITGVYPYFTNKDNIVEFAKLALTTNKTLDITFVSETASNKHSFKLPAKFNVTKITLLNTLSGQYENYDVNKFTTTEENIDVQGKQVAYKVYTRNDGTNGSSSFKITFA